MNKLYNYVFHYNHYTELWSAIPRELYLQYWTDDSLKGIKRSSDIKTLMELITKGEENVKIEIE